ncbi:MAG: class I SAM-dependent methyltransferase [Gemmatimonadetes bacterium]|nr:class I SAM-dependent methyltransferase [Gemmatimonadota bacterium]
MTWTPDAPLATPESLGETDSGARNLPPFLCSLLQPGPVLVLGSSEIAWMVARNHEVVVVDWNRRRLAALEERFREGGQPVRTVCRDPEHQDLGVERRSVANVICVDVLERFENDVAVLGQLQPCLEPGGRLIVRVPTRSDEMTSGIRAYDPELLRETLEQAALRTTSVRYWNFLGLPAAGRASATNPASGPSSGTGSRWRDGALDFWFRNVENRVGMPAGLSLISVATPYLERVRTRREVFGTGRKARTSREAYEPMGASRS